MSNQHWPPKSHALQYQKGENRRKHEGSSASAYMTKERGIWIGKCPKSFSLDIAQALLQNAIPEYRKTRPERPFRLWNYHNGVVYAARSQDDGVTWHGYPNGKPMPEPPSKILRKLEQRAADASEQKQFKDWMKKSWNNP